MYHFCAIRTSPFLVLQRTFQSKVLTGMVHPKIKMLSSLTPLRVPNLYKFHCDERDMEECL